MTICTAANCIGNCDLLFMLDVELQLMKCQFLCSEYHYGKEKSTERTGPNQIEDGNKGTHPPESTFKKLAPSKNRYTLLRDEL